MDEQIIIMYVIKGISMKQISKDIGISVEKVKSILLKNNIIPSRKYSAKKNIIYNKKDLTNYIINNFNIQENGIIFNDKNKIIKTHKDRHGYLYFSYKKYNFYVHRIVCLKFNYIENYEEYECHHIDGNKLNNHKNNLKWLLKKEHILETISMNNISGENNPNTSLTWDDVEYIREQYKINKKNRLFLMDKFGIKKSQFYNIINYVSWKKE